MSSAAVAAQSFDKEYEAQSSTGSTTAPSSGFGTGASEATLTMPGPRAVTPTPNTKTDDDNTQTVKPHTELAQRSSSPAAASVASSKPASARVDDGKRRSKTRRKQQRELEHIPAADENMDPCDFFERQEVLKGMLASVKTSSQKQIFLAASKQH